MASQRIPNIDDIGAKPPATERFHGESLKSYQVPGFILSECLYPPRFETPLHSHRRALFCLAIEGAYTAKYGLRTCTCEPSSLVFHAPDELHSEHFRDSGGRFFIIEIEPWWLERLRKQAAIIESSADFNGSPLTLFGLNLYKEFQEMDEVSPLIVEGLMLAMIGRTSRRPATTFTAQPPPWLEQAKQLMQDRFREALTLTEIANSVGVSPAYLTQMFHKYYHYTVGVYLRRLRIEFACQAIIVSNTPLCQIALAAGFSDQSHLTRMFKRYMGVTPAQYRESLAKP